MEQMGAAVILLSYIRKALGLFMYLGLNIGYHVWYASLCYSALTAIIRM